MANTLKSITYSGNNSYSVADSDATIYTVPAATTTIVIGFSISNLKTSVVEVTAKMTDASASRTVNLLKDVPIAAGAALEIMGGNKLILEASDVIIIACDTINGFDAVLSIVEQT